MQFPLYNGTFVFDNNYDDGIQKNFHTDLNLEEANSIPIRWVDINQ